MPVVDSDALAQVEYEPSARTLFVRFSSGEWYAYLDVPRLAFQRLLAADSKGRFFQEAIRDRYVFVKLSLP